MIVNDEAVVIYGDFETGKTLNALVFSKFYRKSHIVDDWDGQPPSNKYWDGRTLLTPQTLALLNPFCISLEKLKSSTNYLFIDIETAKDTLRADGITVHITSDVVDGDGS